MLIADVDFGRVRDLVEASRLLSQIREALYLEILPRATRYYSSCLLRSHLFLCCYQEYSWLLLPTTGNSQLCSSISSSIKALFPLKQCPEGLARVSIHSITCSNDGPQVQDCPMPYVGSLLKSDGGEEISEYEVEWNERPGFQGTGGGRRNTTTSTPSVLNNLYGRQMYFLRMLACYSVRSGTFLETVA